jgi:4-hydroxy-tetrahydrodipicolinate reductase
MTAKRIMLIGYGKMGQAIEKIALQRGNTIVYKIDVNNSDDLKNISSKDVDVAIEFTQPESAYQNVKTCLQNGIPVVCGTTGWLEHKPEIEAMCKARNGAFFYASNYSIGVNIFFKVNEFLANMMNEYPDYQIAIEEIHHTQKKDAPSGTAITLAEGIFKNIPRKTEWVLDENNIAKNTHSQNNLSIKPNQIPISALRITDVPGTHTIFYQSEIDTIEIKHTAHTRYGFALGATLAAEFLVGKKGVFDMNDLLFANKII